MKKILSILPILCLSAYSMGFSPEQDWSIREAFEKYCIQQQARGAALMVTDGDGNVVSAAYGVRNAKGDPYTTATPNRVASVSKILTTGAIMVLVRDNKLTLDTRVLAFLNEKNEKPFKPIDPRMGSITVRHLLQHSGGFTSDRFMWDQIDTAKAHRYPTLPIPRATLVSHALTKLRLGTNPGVAIKYSNIGMMILGQVIEKASGETYEAYVRKALLTPAGISASQAYVGNSKKLGSGETEYWDLLKRTGMSLYPGDAFKRTPFEYGGAYTLEEIGPCAGWVMSVEALTKFQQILPKLVPLALQDEIVQRPASVGSGQSYQGLGFNIIAESLGGFTFSHSGNLEGCSANAMYRANGQVISVTFNTGSSPTTNNWGAHFTNTVLVPMLNRMAN